MLWLNVLCFGGSWAAFGGVLECLGGILGHLEAVLVVMGRFGSFSRQHRAASRRLWVPKRGQVEVKIGPKTEQNRRQKRRWKKKLLKIILEPSWSDLGSILGRLGCPRRAKIVLWPTRRSFFWKSTFLKKSGLKRRLGAILGRFGCPRGSKMGAAEGQERS